MNANIKMLSAFYEINSTLLSNSFKGVEDSLSVKRPNNKTNSMLFIALHLIDARYFILSQVGGKSKNPFREYLDWSDSIEGVKRYPSKGDVLSEWTKLNSKFIRKISSLDSGALKKKLEIQFPGGSSVFHMISFLAEHEAYHVGQLGLIRKFLGFPSVEY